MKKTLILLLSILILFSCGTAHKKKAYRNKYLFSVKVDTSNFTETVTYTDFEDAIIIPVKIQGKTYQFLFDTGAATILSDELVKTIDTKAIKDTLTQTVQDGAGITRNGKFSILPHLQLGKVGFSHIGFSAQDLSKFQKRCLHIDGIFGTNMMRRCFWKIDYKNHQISFSDRKKAIALENPAVTIPFKESFSGSPQIAMAFNNPKKGFWALWDTGYTSEIQIPDSLFFKLGKPKKVPSRSAEGLKDLTLFQNGKKIVAEQMILADSLHFQGGLLLKNQLINISPSPSILLGNKFSSHGQIVVFDWKDHTISLEKKPSIHNTKNFGFVPFKTGKNITVAKLWKQSKVQKEGLRLGDIIVSINRQNVENMTQTSWCEKFIALKKADKIEFTVRKGKSEKSYSAEKQDLFK